MSVVACSGPTGTVANPPSASARATATPTVGATASIRVEALRHLLSDTGRTALRVCVYVDPAASANAAQATTLFDTTLMQLKASFTPAIAVDAVSAFQTAPVFLVTNSRHVQNSSSALPVGAPVRVAKTEVSQQVLVVAVTTNAKIDAIFGGLATRRGMSRCCVTVATALKSRPPSTSPTLWSPIPMGVGPRCLKVLGSRAEPNIASARAVGREGVQPLRA